MGPVPNDILAVLRRAGLVDSATSPTGEPLTGGVSSDIWRVDLPAGPVCVKRALAQLRVKADWRAPRRAQRLRGRVDSHRGQRSCPRRRRGCCSGPGGRCRGHELSPAGPLSAVEAGAARRRGRSRDRRRRRRRPGPDPCRHGPPAGHRRPVPDRRHLPRHPARALPDRHRRVPIPRWPRRWAGSRGAPPPPSSRWCTATSARRTSCSGRTGRCSSTPSAPGTAIRRSTSPSASTTCC